MNTPSITVELLRIALLLFMFVGYVAICAWAFAPRNRERFEAAARIPLQPSPGSDAPAGRKPAPAGQAERPA